MINTSHQPTLSFHLIHSPHLTILSIYPIIHPYNHIDQLLRWLAAVKKARVGHLPIVAANEFSFPLFQKNATGGIYGWKGCTEIKAAGWYQPFVLNKAALEVLKVATKNYGATQVSRYYC